MHPDLRAARALYHEWRHLPVPDRERAAPLAREVKAQALDLRGHVDIAAAARKLAAANAALAEVLRTAQAA